MQKNTVWLDNSIFQWDSTWEAFGGSDDKMRRRAYDIWERANSLLIEDTIEFNRADAITNLKRCLNQRLQYIDSLYSFRKIANDNAPKGCLEYLETLGIVRPYMLKQLMSIRNDIEHRDVPAPATDRCYELIDITWYFLKSTDSLVIQQNYEFAFYNSEYHFNIEIDYKNDYAMSISGWFPASLVCEQESENSTKVIINSSISECNTDKLNDRIKLVGKLEPSKKMTFDIVKICINSK